MEKSRRTFTPEFKMKQLKCIVSPHSNNAYKHAEPPGTIHVSKKGGAFLMLQQKLTIVPVTLHPDSKSSLTTASPKSYSSISSSFL